LAASVPTRYLVRESNSEVMQLSAQLANSVAGVLLVFPMFYLGKGLFDRRVGFWSAALFHCLPIGSRVLSDALSEGVFLFLAVGSRYAAVIGHLTNKTTGMSILKAETCQRIVPVREDRARRPADERSSRHEGRPSPAGAGGALMAAFPLGVYWSDFDKASVAW